MECLDLIFKIVVHVAQPMWWQENNGTNASTQISYLKYAIRIKAVPFHSGMTGLLMVYKDLDKGKAVDWVPDSIYCLLTLGSAHHTTQSFKSSYTASLKGMNIPLSVC